jgi:hypothetical protein
MTMLALAFSGYTTLAGCNGRGGATAPGIVNVDSVGTVSLALQLAGGGTINSANYTITGPNGFTKSATLDLSKSTTLTTTIGGLPAGTGFKITLSANTSDGASCGGSAMFDVIAGMSRAVSVPLSCHQAAKTGSVVVSGKLNLCATNDGVGANPAEVQVGGTVALTGSAHDSDAGPSAVTYAWAATGGTLSDASAANPTFTCGSTPGMASVTLTVSDGDPACADTQTAQINCTAAARTAGAYVAGDFHNHTTCSDGTISMQKLIKKATDKVETPWGLDWFVQAGHGGNGNRNCTLVEDATLATPAYPFIAGKDPNTSWENSGVTLKGDPNGTSPNRNMWRWQSVQEIQYPLIEYLNALKNLPLFIGLETVVPGHEHTSMSVITGQIPTALDTATLPTTPGYTALGNANNLAQFEYCFDRADGDTSRGAANQWDCSTGNSPMDPTWSATAHKLIQTGSGVGSGVGTQGRRKTLDGLKWMAQNAPNESYYVPAHLERAGQFDPDGNQGFNVEDLRDFNNTAPKIAFGMETQPGHGASANRGEYQVLRNTFPNGMKYDSVGGTTFGGTGVYGGIVGGVWDSMLGEGRNFWFFASSDWHNRGLFGPDDRRSTQDFFPGEYQRNYTLVRNGSDKIRPQMIVDGLRTGNNFGTQGQLIDRLGYVACVGKTDGQVAEISQNGAFNKTSLSVDGCATMGEKLSVPAGSDIVVGVTVRDPDGANFSPYTFANPSLAQIGVTQPINMPVLDHIDLIGGLVTGYRSPTGPDYAGEWPRNEAWLTAAGATTGLGSVPTAAKNTSTAVLKTFNGAGATPWQSATSYVDGTKFLTMTFRIPAVAASQYLRLRGTNMPPMVPSETDASGNPLSDVFTNANDPKRLTIPCTPVHSAMSQFDGCPDHLQVAAAPSPIAGQKAVSFDVAAWADLWFYSNPIYIQVAGSTVVAGVQ